MSFGFTWFRAPTFADVAQGRDNNLNLLRMVAASSVLFSHSYALTGHMLEEPLVIASAQRTDAATIGVVVFFAISGFLIAQSLARTPSLYAYAIARTLRIVPGLMLAKLFCVLVIGWYATSLASAAYWTHADTWRFLFACPYFDVRDRLPGVFEHNPYPLAVDGSLWTIPVETWCYAAAAVLALVTLLRRPAAFTVAALAATGVYAMLPQQIQTWMPSGGYGTIPALLFTFMFAAWLHACRRAVPVSLPLAALIVVLLVLDADVRYAGAFHYAGIAYVALVLAYHPRLRWRTYLRFGDYSYGTYVLAFPVQQFVIWRFGVTQPIVLFGLALVTTIALAIASWHLVEKPALGLKSRLRTWRPRLRYGLRRTTRS
jgi:peptidoglycan/LPS O-acetylase OafA/YrhL